MALVIRPEAVVDDEAGVLIDEPLGQQERVAGLVEHGEVERFTVLVTADNLHPVIV